jgi:hypothetical protein
MKIAIVTGWKGVQQQKRRWGIEREIKTMEDSIVNTERNLRARRTALANLKIALEKIPNQEVSV